MGDFLRSLEPGQGQALQVQVDGAGGPAALRSERYIFSKFQDGSNVVHALLLLRSKELGISTFLTYWNLRGMKPSSNLSSSSQSSLPQEFLLIFATVNSPPSTQDIRLLLTPPAITSRLVLNRFCSFPVSPMPIPSHPTATVPTQDPGV